jgi:hypothetical protein
LILYQTLVVDVEDGLKRKWYNMLIPISIFLIAAWCAVFLGDVWAAILLFILALTLGIVVILDN